MNETKENDVSTEDAIIHTLAAVREYNRPAPTGYLLAANMNMVHSTLRPTLDRMAVAGLIVQHGPRVPDGIQVMPGNATWALAERADVSA